MSKNSKFIKLNRDILLEYIYDDSNLISEPYNILVNSKDRKQSYVATESSLTNNNIKNQLFLIDSIQNKFGTSDPNLYSFLELKNYGITNPIKHDTIKIHVPINWTFGEYLGFHLRIYGLDTNNQSEIELSNFFFDMTDINQQYLLNFTSPPLLFQEKLWGKNILLQIPSLNELSSQLTNNLPTINSINSNLTKGSGFNLFSPIFVDFYFIEKADVINNIKTYILESPIRTSLPQTPEFERLGLKIEPSKNGDFFEIYGTYNQTISEFNKFIQDSIFLGNRYFVQYNITIFEQNIRGKTTSITLTNNFNESVEFRPIIKYSTTTAIIDVEMKLVDSVDDSIIIRRSSYGMLQDEVSKYSLYMKKINLTNASKPKIYNIKNSIDSSLVGISNSMGMILVDSFPKKIKNTSLDVLSSNNLMTNNQGGVFVEQIKVPFPILVERFNVIAKSFNSEFNSKTFFGFGKIKILLYPFDNIISFYIATGTNESAKYFDLTGFSEIKLVIKNDSKTISFSPFIESEEIDLVNGLITFKIDESKFSDIKRIYNSGSNVFYITGTNISTTTVIYTGLFKIFDDLENLSELSNQIETNNNNNNITGSIILDTNNERQTAIARPSSMNSSSSERITNTSQTQRSSGSSESSY